MFSIGKNDETLDSILGVFNSTLDKLLGFITRKKEENQKIQEEVSNLKEKEAGNFANISKAEYTVAELKKLLGK